MGSYSTFKVGDYHLDETKGRIDQALATLFRESDKRLFWIDAESGNEVAPGAADALLQVTYEVPVRVAIDRLNVMGFTLHHASEEFQIGLQVEVEMLEEGIADGHADLYEKELEKLEGVTFDDYMVALREAFEKRLYAHNVEEYGGELHPLLRKLVVPEYQSYFWERSYLGFFGDDPRHLVRLLCSFAEPDDTVVMDLSDLVGSGIYRPEDHACENAAASLTAAHPLNAPRIILTEGPTDHEFLDGSLELLFPHLVGYYTFLDFGAARAPGGAGNLAAIVKAFAGTGISNRVVAVFDGDTAAADAVRGLGAIKLPSNIAVVRLPALEVLRNYPTLGPTGKSNLDVNGLAASIELYFGADILETPDGPTPIQWKGYVSEMRSYQGEVIEKARLQDAFREKVKRARKDPSLLKTLDWTGMQAIWKAIIAAFR
jgi:hypothetical protein